MSGTQLRSEVDQQLEFEPKVAAAFRAPSAIKQPQWSFAVIQDRYLAAEILDPVILSYLQGETAIVPRCASKTVFWKGP